MPTNREVAELMEKVKEGYERIQTLHSVACYVLEFIFTNGHNCGTLQSCGTVWIQEIWFRRPKLRVERSPSIMFSVPEAACLPQSEEAPELLITDGKHEYRFSSGKWVRAREGWRSVDLLELHGLFSQVQYTSMREGEHSGRSVWVVEGEIEPGGQVTWWVDKDTLTIHKYRSKFKDLEPDQLEGFLTVEFLKFEPGLDIPDEKFSVPSEFLVDEHPITSFFEELLGVGLRLLSSPT